MITPIFEFGAISSSDTTSFASSLTFGTFALI